MRDRLIEDIKNSLKRHIGKSCWLAKNIADDLIADGWMRPPCKVGDTVYFVVELEDGNKFIHSQQINDVSTRGIFVSSLSVGENCGEFESYSEFGKTVFLSKEEAEKALTGKDEGK